MELVFRSTMSDKPSRAECLDSGLKKEDCHSHEVKLSRSGSNTVFRQNSLTLDAVIAYDPMAGSYAFSPLGFSGTTCGVGDAENCHFSTAVKYRANVGPVRVGALWQFGGYQLNNGSNGAGQVQLGGDIYNLGFGTLSLDGIYSYVRDAVALGLTGGTINSSGMPIAPFPGRPSPPRSPIIKA